MGMNAENREELWESAHAIEHMLASMTSKQHRDAKKMAEELNLRGIHSNAETTPASTSYFMSSLKCHTKWMVDALLAMYMHPHFDPKIFEQEMKSVTQELASGISATWHDLKMKTLRLLFPGFPMSVPTIEKLKNVKNLKLPFLTKLAKRWYEPQLVDLYLVGGVDLKTLTRVKKDLSVKSPGNTSPMAFQPVERKWGRIFRAKGRSKSNLGLMVAFPLDLDRFDYRKARAAACVSHVLTKGFSSRLYRALRSHRGSIYSISSEAQSELTPENSFFLLSTEVSPEKIETVTRVICATVRELAHDGPTPKELKKWRESVRTTDAEDSLSQDPAVYVDSYRPYLSWSCGYPTRKKMSDISLSLTASYVRSIAQEIFQEDCLVVHTGNRKLDEKLLFAIE